MELPLFFINHMKELLADDCELFLNCLNQKPNAGIRANNLKISTDKLPGLFGLDLKKINWCEDGYYIEDSRNFSKSPFYYAGLYYIQEPSAMLPVSLLKPEPGEKVLDLCAAPGGKTTQIASKMLGKGVLVANDVSRGRIKPLLKNMNLAGVTNGVVLCQQPEQLTKTFNSYFDKILVDAPCSGEGMIRIKPESVKEWASYEKSRFPEIQLDILSNAYKMLSPGGSLVYSTCTFNIYENEKIIQQLLQYEDIKLITKHRIFPHKEKGEGHFATLLQKSGQKEKINTAFLVLNKNDFTLFDKFRQEFLVKEFKGNFVLHEKSLFLQPEGLPDLKGLRVSSSGFYLGDFEKSYFKPSQALALALKPEDVKNVVNFNIENSDDEMLIMRYLNGESFEYNTQNGWQLVCVNNFPLGFAKCSEGYLKNKYDKNWLV